MAIRVNETSDGQRRVLRIDGRLTSQDVAELDKSFAAAGWPHVLDLTNLQSADTVGVDKLRELIAHGAQLQGVSPYLQLLLDNGK